MNSSELLEKIKSTGYWRVNIRPIEFNASRIPQLSDCWDLVESGQTRLRGWNFPHIDRDYHRNMDDWIESGTEFMDMKEYWRFYQSGQFIHYFAFTEDYHEVSWVSSTYETGKPEKWLGIISTLYRLTEIFEFATRLASKGILAPSAKISIKLADAQNRHLVFEQGSRILRGPYVCDRPEIAFERTYMEPELRGEARELALTAAVHVYEPFNWNDPPRHVFAEDQKKLLERRL